MGTAVALEGFSSRPGSSSGQNTTAELIYSVTGTDDDAAAISAAADEAPLTFTRGGFDLVIRNYTIEPVWADETTGDGVWTVTVHYARADAIPVRPVTGERVFSFDTSGGSRHITQSIQTMAAYAATGYYADPDDYGGAIGVTDQSVEGIDIPPSGGFRFSVTAYIDNDDVDAAYIGRLFTLTDCVNDGTFNVFGFASFGEGECLFLGAQGSKRGDGSDWEIQFSFAAQPNVDDVGCTTIPGIAKRGWEYVWYRYAHNVVVAGLCQQPVQAYVEQVLYESDLGALDPGWSPPP